MKQLPLPFGEQASYAEADFLAAPSNALALKWLDRPAEWTNGRLVLWGEPGCGKTHLLQVWARRHAACLIDGAQLRAISLPVEQPLAIDDADTAPCETALLHLLNTAAEAHLPVLLTAQQPPARQPPRLPDLASRLRASLTAEIRPPEDELLAALLARLAADRQLTFSIPVQNFLLGRLPRTPAALCEAVARLNHATLDSHGRITRNLAAELLGDLLGEPAVTEPSFTRS